MTTTSISPTAQPARTHKTRLSIFFDRPYSKAVVIYALGTLLALLPVASGGWADAGKRLLLVTVSIVVFFVIRLFFNRPARLRWLSALLVLGTTGVAVLGTAQVDTSTLRLTGLNYQVYSTLRRIIPLGGLPTVNQNVLGGFLVTFVGLALGLVLFEQRWWLRLYGLLCSLVIIGCILTTASRSAQLGLLVLFFAFGLLLTAEHPRLRRGLAALLALTLATGAVFLMLNGLSSVENGTSRTEVWRSALAMISDYPLTGAGLAQFPRHFLEYASPFLSGSVQPHAHNIFLQSLVEFGICGFIALLLMLWTTVRFFVSYNNLKNIDASLRPVVGGAMAGMTVYFGSGLLEYGNWGGKFAPAFWILPGILAASGINLTRLDSGWIKLKYDFDWSQWRLPIVLAGAAVVLFLVAPLGLINTATLIRPAQVSQGLYQVAAGTSFWNATPLRDLGKLALTNNDPALAQVYFRQALERDSDDWLSLVPLAELTEKVGDHKQALTYWRRANSVPYFLQLANQDLTATPRNYADAEKYLKLALEIDPANNAAVTALGKVYTDTNRKSDALALLQNFLAQHPDAVLYEQAADLAATPEEQLDLLLKANSLNSGTETANVYWKLGNTYQTLNQPNNAEQAYRLSMTAGPTFQRPVRSLADLYIKENQLAEAQALLEKFISNNIFVEKPDPEFVLLAQSYNAQGNTPAAQAALAKALQYNPASVPAYIYQAELFNKAGNKEQAIAAYEKVLQLDPTNASAKQNLAKLKAGS